jgi:hypothetical protein
MRRVLSVALLSSVAPRSLAADCHEEPGFTEILDLPPAELALASPTGKLVLGSAGTCSGGLIAPNLFLTAGHCMNATSDPEGLCSVAYVVFEHHEGVRYEGPQYPCEEVLEVVNDAAFGFVDVALIRLGGGAPGDVYGFYEVEFDEPVEGDPLRVYSHPEGSGKKMSTGVHLGELANSLFAHDVLVCPASSGAPILDPYGRVVGLIKGETTGNSLADMIGYAPSLNELDWLNQQESGVPETADHFGHALATGDFDGDGHADLVVAAAWDSESGAGAGMVSIRYGGVHALDPASEVAIVGVLPEEGDAYGSALAVGDFNGDGVDDLAVGVPHEDAVNAGAVHVYWGVPNLGIHPVSALLNGLVVAATDVGAPASYGRFGAALAAGDFDGDGADDLAVAAPGEADSAGAVYVLSGADPATAVRIAQEDVGLVSALRDGFGSALATGDLDGDSVDDLAIGVPFEAPGGAVVVVPGGRGGLDPVGADIMVHSESFARYGWALAVGDVDNDGVGDLAVGAPLHGVADVGMVELRLSSGAIEELYAVDSVLPLAAEGSFGTAVAIGDVDGDALLDLVVGDPERGVLEDEDGAVVVYFDGVFGNFALSPAALVLSEPQSAHDDGDGFGASLAVLGTGTARLAVGAPDRDGGRGAVAVVRVED